MCNVQFCAHHLISLLDLFGRNTVRENVGVSRGPEENKKTASASCKLYVLAPAFKNSQRCGQREKMQQRKRKFLQKSVGERFGVGVTTVWLLVGFFRPSELTGPVGPAEKNWPNCPAFRNFDRNSGFLFFHPLATQKMDQNSLDHH